MATIIDPRQTRHARAGFTLTEILIALVLGMLIVLATTTLLISSRSLEASAADLVEMQDNASFAMSNITTALQQAGFVSIEPDNGPWVENDNLSAAISGLDASTLRANSEGITGATPSQHHSSDVLAIRFSGSGRPADHTIINCAGIGVAAARQHTQELERGWSIYYVANDASGEPSLYCKYNKDHFTAQPIATGVESFQILYGLDTGNPPHGIANQFLTASAITALDAGIAPDELNRRTHWKKITAVKVAMLIRGKSNKISDGKPTVFDLFGPQYAAGADLGTKITEADIVPALRSRLRLVYNRTIALQNPLR